MPDWRKLSRNSQGKPEVAGATMVADGSASRIALDAARERVVYWRTSGLGLQNWPLGSFQISQRMWRPRKCFAEAAAQRAKAS